MTPSCPELRSNFIRRVANRHCHSALARLCTCTKGQWNLPEGMIPPLLPFAKDWFLLPVVQKKLAVGRPAMFVITNVKKSAQDRRR
jgi:hypothetical protein